MNKITKLLLWAFIPIILVVLAIVLIPIGEEPIYGLIALILLILLGLAFVNIFVQGWRMGKHAEKDPQLKQQIMQRTKIWNMKSFWVFFIMFLVFISGLDLVMEYYNLSLYLKIIITVISLIIIFVFVYNPLKKKFGWTS